ncbi:MAG: DUF6236 family protein [Pseudomonadota bacterium]
MQIDQVRGIILPSLLDSAWYPDHEGSAGDYEMPDRREFSGTENPEKIPAYILFWDKLVSIEAANRVLSQTDAEKYLETDGLLSRVHVASLEPGNVDQVQIQTFRVLEDREPGVWCIARNTPFRPHDLGPGRSLLVRLHDVLPIPTAGVPLEDLLQFRERRNAERLALRYYLEKTFLEIASAEDSSLAFRTTADALSKSIRDQLAVTEEAGLRFRFGSLEARLKWEFSSLPGTGGAAVGFSLGGLEASIAAALAGIASNAVPKIELSWGAGVNRKNDHAYPLEYIVHLNREFASRAP